MPQLCDSGAFLKGIWLLYLGPGLPFLPPLAQPQRRTSGGMEPTGEGTFSDAVLSLMISGWRGSQSSASCKPQKDLPWGSVPKPKATVCECACLCMCACHKLHN